MVVNFVRGVGGGTPVRGTTPVSDGAPVREGTPVRGTTPVSDQGRLLKSTSFESLSSGEWMVLSKAMVLSEITGSLDAVSGSNSSGSGSLSPVTDGGSSPRSTHNGFRDLLSYLNASQADVRRAVLTGFQRPNTPEYSIPNQIELTLDLKEGTSSEFKTFIITLSEHSILERYVSHQATIKKAPQSELLNIQSELKARFGKDVPPGVFEFRKMVLEAVKDLLSKDSFFNDGHRLDQYNIANLSTHNVEYRKALLELVKLHKRLFPTCIQKLLSEY